MKSSFRYPNVLRCSWQLFLHLLCLSWLLAPLIKRHDKEVHISCVVFITRFSQLITQA